ncbi:hypothetical protein EON63_13100 [archaeon]|nr:MAG: hypothetical protein EON63_13100 [archaeon]
MPIPVHVRHTRLKSHTHTHTDTLTHCSHSYNTYNHTHNILHLPNQSAYGRSLDRVLGGRGIPILLDHRDQQTQLCVCMCICMYEYLHVSISICAYKQLYTFVTYPTLHPTHFSLLPALGI